ncbi:exported protein of unknown function [Xenorhabdus doucetiae]|uniref:Uncharacterized protein n=1 Tax=Xenorhabdus doucetiae TaxID=351671 RepID=A0A068QW39_9GAMM|nr:exported protein of unknown function [Xenorhabdus doucetiae]
MINIAFTLLLGGALSLAAALQLEIQWVSIFLFLLSLSINESFTTTYFFRNEVIC